MALTSSIQIHSYMHKNKYKQIHKYKYTHTQIHEYTNAQIHKYTNTQIHKYTNTQMHKYTNTAYDEVPERPIMCNIFEKRIVQGHQKLYSSARKTQHVVYFLKEDSVN